MTVPVLLFLLRVASGILLIMILTALFVIMWRDYRNTTRQITETQRTHGQLIGLAEVDGKYLPTGDVYPLLPLTNLGRAPTNTIVLNDTFASSEHALVALRSGQWWLEDRQSKNGTLLNGEPITNPVVITADDIFTIGQMSFRLELEDS